LPALPRRGTFTVGADRTIDRSVGKRYRRLPIHCRTSQNAGADDRAAEPQRGEKSARIHLSLPCLLRHCCVAAPAWGIKNGSGDAFVVAAPSKSSAFAQRERRRESCVKNCRNALIHRRLGEDS